MPREKMGWKTPLDVMNENNQFKPGFKHYPNVAENDYPCWKDYYKRF